MRRNRSRLCTPASWRDSSSQSVSRKLYQVKLVARSSRVCRSGAGLARREADADEWQVFPDRCKASNSLGSSGRAGELSLGCQQGRHDVVARDQSVPARRPDDPGQCMVAVAAAAAVAATTRPRIEPGPNLEAQSGDRDGSRYVVGDHSTADQVGSPAANSVKIKEPPRSFGACAWPVRVPRGDPRRAPGGRKTTCQVFRAVTEEIQEERSFSRITIIPLPIWRSISTKNTAKSAPSDSTSVTRHVAVLVIKIGSRSISCLASTVSSSGDQTRVDNQRG